MLFDEKTDEVSIVAILEGYTQLKHRIPSLIGQKFHEQIYHKFRDNSHISIQKACIRFTLVWLENFPSLDLLYGIMEKFLFANECLSAILLDNLTCDLDELLKNLKISYLILLFCGHPRLELKIKAFRILKRIAPKNPAFILPSLQEMIHSNIFNLKYSQDLMDAQISSFVLNCLMRVLEEGIDQCSDAIYSAVSQGIESKCVTISVNCMKALQFMYQNCQGSITKHTREIIPILIRLFSHSDYRKKVNSLKTIADGAFFSCISHDLWQEYPLLYNLLLDTLKHYGAISGGTGAFSICQANLNREILRTLGMIGAIDPYHVHTLGITPTVAHLKPDAQSEQSMQMLPIPSSSAFEEFYPIIAINSLIKIIQEQNQPYQFRYEAFIVCLRILTVSSPKLMAHFHLLVQFALEIIRKYELSQAPILIISGCTELVLLGREHLLPYLDEIVGYFAKSWKEKNVDFRQRIEFVHLIVAIKEALHSEILNYIGPLIPFIVDMIRYYCTCCKTLEDEENFIQIFSALASLSIYLEQYLLLILPSLTGIIKCAKCSLKVKISCLALLDMFQSLLNLDNYFLQIWNCCIAIASDSSSSLRPYALTFCLKSANLLRDRFPLFLKNLLPLIPEGFKIQNYAISLPLFQVKSDVMGYNLDFLSSYSAFHPRISLEESQLVTKEDWEEWIKSFIIDLLSQSNNLALKLAIELAVKYPPLARDLFHAAFLSNWSPIKEEYQEEIIQIVERVLIHPNVPSDIVHAFLNLAEFLEHDEKELPIDYKSLGTFSTKNHAFAKALHYRELDYAANPQPFTVEALLSINSQLQLPDAATGILAHSQRIHSIELRENWYEKLHRWDDALQVYQERLIKDPQNEEAFIGLLRCKHSLGDWEDIHRLVQKSWISSSKELQTTIAPLAAASAWALSSWDSLETFLQSISEQTPEGCFFRAIGNVHQNNWEKAHFYIEKTRDLISIDMSSLLNESYNRAYSSMIRVQLLTELEEIILYKTVPSQRANIQLLWEKRLRNVQPNVDVWHRILKVRSLLFSYSNNLDGWLSFLSLCRKHERPIIAHNTLKSLLGEFGLDLDFIQNPDVAFLHDSKLSMATLKHMWLIGQKTNAISCLKRYMEKVLEKIRIDQRQTSELAGKCFRLFGDWLIAYKDKGISRENMEEVLHAFKQATKFDPSSVKSWHKWAVANFEVVTLIERKNDTSLKADIPNFLANAVKGFLKSVSMSCGSPNAVLQDVLRLVTILFKYGSRQEINQLISEGISSISIDSLLNVIPQIIARIHAPSPHVRRLVHQILLEVGRLHPQSIIYSLTVASKSQNPTRRAAALSLIERMRAFHPNLVDQALSVSFELIRISVLWHEMWHEGLEEASRRYFGEKNVPGMFSVLNPLHQILDKGPETPLESAFCKQYGKNLHEAREWCKKYHRTGNLTDINQAWDLYYGVFRELSKQISQFSIIELEQASPRLQALKNQELSVPGTYDPSSKNLIKIQGFEPILYVIASKQRPRRIHIKGMDGNVYCYLLKGHEDIRQDQRVMQFFSLVNNLIQADQETYNRHLSIRTFPVIPLSPNSGLIGWVNDCDTLHSLIKNYREAHQIPLNLEHRLMLQMAPDYDNLTFLQKIEVFEHALRETSGQDLAKIFWLRSKNSEEWLEHRTTYIRSLATMSIVGYVLGLGDRHPSNLMIDRQRGQVIHIDFGDCFEAAMNREKFPEKIPFRLTRMLINAMEVSGIEGTFRITCEHVFRVLRQNKESLMAILEAFIYDPLVTSKINNAAAPTSTRIPPPSNTSNILPHHPAAGQENFPEGTGRGNYSMGKTFMPADAEIEMAPENLNAKALQIVRRVSNKLSGRDFGGGTTPVDVGTQVSRLINEATAVENLSQCYIGWCPFW